MKQSFLFDMASVLAILAGGRIAASGGVLLWVSTLLALGACAAFSAILAAQELWRLRRNRPRTTQLESL